MLFIVYNRVQLRKTVMHSFTSRAELFIVLTE